MASISQEQIYPGRSLQSSAEYQEQHTSSSSSSSFNPSVTNIPGRKRVSSILDQSSGKRRSQGGPYLQQTYNGAGGTFGNPIDLTMGSESPSASRLSGNNNTSLAYDNPILPMWQPDTDVTSCPVCKTPFSLMHRRHHCRKCGKVVCANCSPHRITIPRQFIVQPPSYAPDSSSPVQGIYTGGGPSMIRHNGRNSIVIDSSGGETVRVCNPCVPDPNHSIPPQQFLSHPSATQTRTVRSHSSIDPRSTQNREWNRNDDLHAGFARSRSFSTRIGPVSRSDSIDQMPRTHFDQTNTSRQTEQFARVGLAASGTTLTPRYDELVNQLQARTSATPTMTGYRPSRYVQGPALYSSGSFGAPLSTRAAIAPFHDRHGSLSEIGAQSTVDPVIPRPSLPSLPTRPQIAEEDECPVCGRELPPLGLNGDEAQRIQHVSLCILNYSSSTTSNRAHPVDVPNTHNDPSPLHSPAHSRSTSQITELPSTSLTQHGIGQGPPGNRMLVYRASEKDCVGKDGETQECIICFEDFEAGAEMGRLECLCVFHRACIRQWWTTKGSGNCPTHQLHD